MILNRLPNPEIKLCSTSIPRTTPSPSPRSLTRVVARRVALTQACESPLFPPNLTQIDISINHSIPVPANTTDNFPTWTLTVNNVSDPIVWHRMVAYVLSHKDRSNLGLLSSSRKDPRQPLWRWHGLRYQLWFRWCPKLVHQFQEVCSRRRR